MVHLWPCIGKYLMVKKSSFTNKKKYSTLLIVYYSTLLIVPNELNSEQREYTFKNKFCTWSKHCMHVQNFQYKSFSSL